ncbi:UPF0175 family protein [Anaerovibrio sp. RM50]|uniref:UPF0175 family protein n=1 Tax=Anaerovibrio sp. RM50 TaxID=1200557 RepID=UPI00047FFFB8|nr:UPF0175 family protein [Anaerovibrio sp. RM50]
MCTLSIEIPDEILLNIHKTQDEVVLYMKQLYAVDLYKKKQMSLGDCAALAEMSKEEFIHFLAEFKVSIFSFDDDEDFENELKNA